MKIYQRSQNKFIGTAKKLDFGKDMSIRHNVFSFYGSENKFCTGCDNSICYNKFYINGNNNIVKLGNNIQMYGNDNWQSIHIDGSNNKIVIEDNTALRSLKIFIWGDNNIVHIGKDCSITLTGIHMEQSDNCCIISDKTTTHGRDNKIVQFELDEATTIFIDKDCMISNDVVFRSSDSHSVLNENGQRTNFAKNIKIGKHCWIGMRSMIMKGVSLSDNCIVGAGSILTKSFSESNVVIAGLPAKIVKQKVNWDRKFINMER